MGKNGICKKNVEGSKRIHTITKKVDGAGREFRSCDRCGFVEIDPVHYLIAKK